MNLKLGKKIGTGVIVFLITACFVPALAGAGAAAPGNGRQDKDKGFGMNAHHRTDLGIWRNPQLVQQLELTEGQLAQLREADFTFREKRLALKAQLDRLRLQMDKAFSEDTVDDTAVRKAAQEMSDVRGKLFVQHVESRLAVGKILNSDQVKKLKLYGMHQKKQGARHGGKQMSRFHSIEPK